VYRIVTVIAVVAALLASACNRASRHNVKPPLAPVSYAELTNLDLLQIEYPHSAQFTGRIRNRSQRVTLRDISVELTIWDCPLPEGGQQPLAGFVKGFVLSPQQLQNLPPDERAGVAVINQRLLADCETVEQQRLLISQVVPPHQARDFQRNIAFPQLRAATGEHLWTYRVVAAEWQ
jgi:hypothetical protein